MSINHHPSDALLLDYASGALGETWGLGIATHLALCPECRRTVALMEDIGGGLLDALPPAPVSEGSFDALLARLDDVAPEPAAGTPATAPASAGAPVLPLPLRDYVGSDIDGIRWRQLGMGARQFILPMAQKGVTARLLWIPAGKPVLEHAHGGQELTLVLRGSFSDETGHYARGDLQEADESLSHQPHAAPGEDCICLAITDAPLRFKSLAARMVQPLLRI